ncbi:hypothetical protein Pdsh_04200 [Pyrodictium delaneyi]|uniref:Uncharacterized protein n=1 Tax=Pyrodictium delaneyi TaxID=1273541 RepID=A0A211YPQ9_9CREN|nr:hypothetical protein Pdsh_04200 [Pyrodictium delaneyi]
MDLREVLERLREYGLRCSVSPEELLAYIQGPSYEDDRVTQEEILGEELLLLHEAAEICILKNMGYRITRGTVVEAYPDTYRAHLIALGIELAEAERLGRLDWIARRCRDLASYFDDPHLPSGMEDAVSQLISRYCGGVLT